MQTNYDQHQQLTANVKDSRLKVLIDSNKDQIARMEIFMGSKRKITG